MLLALDVDGMHWKLLIYTTPISAIMHAIYTMCLSTAARTNIQIKHTRAISVSCDSSSPSCVMMHAKPIRKCSLLWPKTILWSTWNATFLLNSIVEDGHRSLHNYMVVAFNYVIARNYQQMRFQLLLFFFFEDQEKFFLLISWTHNGFS